MTQNKIFIYGKHAIREALMNAPQALKKVMIAKYFDDKALLELVKQAGINVGSFTPDDTRGFDGRIEKDATHQGIIGQISVNELVRPYQDFVEKLNITPATCIVVLGELQDPHNVGAVIRSAAAFGAAGVLIPEHNQAPVTGAVVKVSAGMAFRIPLISINNVNNAVRDLKNRGFWIYGLEGESKNSLTEEKFDAPTAIIIGNEAEGIREKTKEICDVLLSIPMNPKCESLNAAASAAIALYAWSSKHPEVVH
jgi:23S rRNA (guanosine2251-2'-O)-methyltransferase